MLGLGERSGSDRVPDRAAVVIKPVSTHSLSKTGIFAEKAGDFRRFPPPPRRIGGPETKANARKARISGPFSRLLGSLVERRNGWLGREDSNLRMGESKSPALPLGDAPIDCLESGGADLARIPLATPVYRGS